MAGNCLKKKGSPCSPGCPGIQYVVHLSLPPTSAGVKKPVPPCIAWEPICIRFQSFSNITEYILWDRGFMTTKMT